jgi:hypothetical protein
MWPIICAAVWVKASRTRRRSPGSGVRWTNPARASRFTMAQVAGGRVPKSFDNASSVIGDFALMMCNAISCDKVSSALAQTAG